MAYNLPLRRTNLLDYLKNRRRYLELQEEAEDRKRWKLKFIKHNELIQVIFHKFMNLLSAYLLIIIICTVDLYCNKRLRPSPSKNVLNIKVDYDGS
jgi:hypothetical protein